MALIHELESSGNILFRYRGQIPVVLFVLAVPVICVTDYSYLTKEVDVWLMGVSIFVSVLGFIFRAYAIGTTPAGTSGRNTKEQVASVLNSTGIYSIVRHPLYVGNYLMWIGIVMYTYSPWYVALVTLMYWLYYERIMFAEERFLERKFGDEYLEWSKKAPAFVPRFGKYVKSKISFSLKAVLRREYSGFLATVIGFLFVALVRDYVVTQDFDFPIIYAYVFGGALLITLILRTLKHSTKVLHEEERS